jgi:FkbM family methyltransferase
MKSAMLKLNKQKLKHTLIDFGVYKPARRLYHNLLLPGKGVELRQCVEFFSSFVRSGDLCFDVGANVGRKTEALLELGATVVAVEPQPSCQRELKALFGGHPRFTLEPKAVGSTPGTARMRVSPMSGLSSLRADWYADCLYEIDVELTTLDALIAVHGVPRFCKIDIEGYELEALRGLSRRIDFVTLEYNKAHLDQTTACLDELSRLGDPVVNFTLAEGFELVSDHWMGREEFAVKVREELQTQPEHMWGGDILIQLNPSSAA